MKRKLLFVLLNFVLLSAACLPAQEQATEIVGTVEQTALAPLTVIAAPSEEISVDLQATLLAMTAQAVVPTAAELMVTASPKVGSISGTLSYPAEGIPAMAIVAFHAGGGPLDYYYVGTSQGQNTYQIDNLPEGTYWVAAYSLGGGGFPAELAAGYTQYVVCGMQPECSDHALMEVPVIGDQVTGNINPQDWYVPEGILPENPLP